MSYEDCTELKIRATDYNRKIQNLMFEIYKRLMDEQSIMGINKDESNIHLPLIKATAILLLSKFWDPAILDPKKGDQDISFMLSLI